MRNSIYFSKDELAVMRASLELYLKAMSGREFGDVHAEGDQGMRARHNIGLSARRKILREIGENE